MPGAYNVMPLTPNDLQWLPNHDIPQPAEVASASRFPTLDELRQALSRLAGFHFEYGPPNSEAPWPIVIKRDEPAELPPSIIMVTPYQGDAEPHGFWFTKAWPPLAVALLRSLATSTGPLILMAVKEGSPIIIQADSDVAEILKTWKHTA